MPQGGDWDLDSGNMVDEYFRYMIKCVFLLIQLLWSELVYSLLGFLKNKLISGYLTDEKL